MFKIRFSTIEDINLRRFTGSGKTYFSERFAEDINAFHLNSDKMRFAISKEPRDDATENESVFRTMDYISEELLKLGTSVIYDANLTKRIFRKRLQELAERHNAEYILLYFETPLDKALKRIESRGNDLTDEQKKFYRKISPEILHSIKESTDLPNHEEKYIRINGTTNYHLPVEISKLIN